MSVRPRDLLFTQRCLYTYRERFYQETTGTDRTLVEMKPLKNNHNSAKIQPQARQDAPGYRHRHNRDRWSEGRWKQSMIRKGEKNTYTWDYVANYCYL